MSSGITVEGIDEFKANLAALNEALPNDLAKELYREGEEIMTASKERYVPVDDGVLKGSGFVAKPSFVGSNQFGKIITVSLGYGGPAAAYAVVQHERMDYKHTVGGAKYLELPALERAPHIGENIAGRLRVRVP